MKTLIRVVSFLFVGVVAQADLVIEQKVESVYLNGKIVTKIKGEQTRIDIPGVLGSDMTVFAYGKTGDVFTLIHASKVALKMSAADVEKLLKSGEADPAKLQAPKATGAKEKIGEWDTEVFEMGTGPGVAKMWVSKDFPNYKAVTAEMSKASKFTNKDKGQFDPYALDLGGMVVKFEATSAAGKMTATVLKAKEEAVDDKEFKMPEGYTEAKLPSLPK